MIEKVKLTQGQADAVEELRKPFIEFYVSHHTNSGWYETKNNPLNDLSLDELTRALYIGYEVEPEYKKGDWVTTQGGITAKIEMILKEDSIKLDVVDVNRNFQPLIGKTKYVKHATPEEIKQEQKRRMFASVGREPWELKCDDIIIRDGSIFIVEHQNDHETAFFNKGFIPNHALDHNFKVVCFADDRRDME